MFNYVLERILRHNLRWPYASWSIELDKNEVKKNNKNHLSNAQLH